MQRPVSALLQCSRLWALRWTPSWAAILSMSIIAEDGSGQGGRKHQSTCSLFRSPTETLIAVVVPATTTTTIMEAAGRQSVTLKACQRHTSRVADRIKCKKNLVRSLAVLCLYFRICLAAMGAVCVFNFQLFHTSTWWIENDYSPLNYLAFAVVFAVTWRNELPCWYCSL